MLQDTVGRITLSSPDGEVPSETSKETNVNAHSSCCDDDVVSPTSLCVSTLKPLPNTNKQQSSSFGVSRADTPTAHETQKAMELADTIVAYCKNMGRTPESVLRKGGFNVSLSRDASLWDIWQMYLRYQSYNPTKSKHIHVSFFVLCIGV